MGLLDGQLAIITGGAAGIGRATAERFAAEGARVAVLDIDGEGAATAAAAIGGVAVVADVADADACAAGIAEAAAALGGVSILVNNAGIGAAMPLHLYSDGDWRRIVGVNLDGTFYGTKAAIPFLKESRGCIVNVASLTGVRPTRFESPYSAAKAGVISLTMAAALEYAPEIRVNCVSPGFIDTNLTAIVLADAGKPMRSKELIAEMAKRGLWTSPGGKTPEATLYAAILREIGAKGTAARFARAGKGEFASTKKGGA